MGPEQWRWPWRVKMKTSWNGQTFQWNGWRYTVHSEVCALCVMWPSSANPPTYSMAYGFHPWDWTSGQQVSFSIMIRGCTLPEQNYLFIIKCNYCKKHLHFIILLRIYSNTLYILHVNQDTGEKLTWKKIHLFHCMKFPFSLRSYFFKRCQWSMLKVVWSLK